MFRLELDVTDLADVRFVVSPLHEAVGSFWPVYGGCGSRAHRPWARQVRATGGIDHELLASLAGLRGWIPDFVAPPPVTARPDITGQLAQVRATEPGKVAADVLAVYGAAALPPCLKELIDDPAELRDRVAGALERYWSLAIAPHWPHVRIRLEADLLYRGLQLAYRGPGTTFGELDRRIRWRDSAIAVDIIRHWRRQVPVAGRGLRLVPSFFTPWPQLPIDIDDPPVLGYPARGAAVLWHPARPAPPAVSRALLGRSRARLLSILDEPASTTELAGRLGVTPSAISQHLRVLAAAGLVTRARAGRAVLYQLTETGARLAGFGDQPAGVAGPESPAAR
jgi:DNA-binding transcriptional ArsR family regulator